VEFLKGANTACRPHDLIFLCEPAGFGRGLR
jgi:hypothetical protein